MPSTLASPSLDSEETMNRLLILLCLLMPLPALSGTLTTTTTAAQDTKLTKARARQNRITCAQYGLPASCTQPQARKAYCERNGFGGISTCAGSTSVDIYSDVQTFWQRESVRLVIDSLTATLDAEDKAAFAAAQEAATKAQKDAACAALGLAAGCLQ